MLMLVKKNASEILSRKSDASCVECFHFHFMIRVYNVMICNIPILPLNTTCEINGSVHLNQYRIV